MLEREIKLFDYQKEFYECDDKNIVLNWSRGAGETFTVLLKILKENPSTVLGININLKSYAEKLDLFKKYFNKVIKYTLTNNKLLIFNEDKIIEIVKLCDAKKGFINYSVDWQIFYNCLSYNTNYRSNKNISIIHVNNYNKKLQKLIYGNTLFEVDYRRVLKFNMLTPTIEEDCKNNKEWYNEFAIFDDPYKDTTYDNLWRSNYRNRKEEIFASYNIDTNNKFLLDTLVKLEVELDAIENNKDTVLTRKNLLNMIIQINKELNNKKE